MSIAWMTAFIDRPAGSFDAAIRMWTAATGSSLSASRGDRGQFATLVPPDGDAYLRVQRVESGGGSHLDLHVDDVDLFALRAVTAGATKQRQAGNVVVLRSPAGFTWCVVRHHGESVRPQPLALAGGAGHLVDQLCLDIPADRYDQECDFWSEVTGWEQRSSTVRPEFRFLVRPASSPLRLLLQRRDDNDALATAHLDLASDDVEGLAAHHQMLGSSVLRVCDHWVVMSDPAGFPYCITSRDPRTGLLPPG